MVDRVQALVWESPGKGGTQNEMVPKEIDPNEDALDARGLFLQDDTSADNNVTIQRDDDGKMQFKDVENPSGYSLAQLAEGGSSINDMLVNQYGDVLSNQFGNVLLKG